MSGVRQVFTAQQAKLLDRALTGLLIAAQQLRTQSIRLCCLAYHVICDRSAHWIDFKFEILTQQHVLTH
jgi:hypothetical protein